MATKRRKQRLERKVNRAFDKGNDSKSLVFTKRLQNIATREGNRAIGNTKIQRAFGKVADPLRNAAGLPARSLTGNVSNAFPKTEVKVGADGKIIPTGSIMSPEQRLIENRNKTVYGPTGKPTPPNSNSQNMDLLESNISPATVSYSGGGSKPAEVVNETLPTEEDFVKQDFYTPALKFAARSEPSRSAPSSLACPILSAKTAFTESISP